LIFTLQSAVFMYVNDITNMFYMTDHQREFPVIW
jgi:hypothetical protein